MTLEGTCGGITIDPCSGSSGSSNTFSNTASISFSVVNSVVMASVIPGGVDHNSLANLTVGNPHTQYALTSSLATVATTGAYSDLTGKPTLVTAHSALTGLTTGDDHTQYALLAGRSGGQSLSGGTVANDDLTLQGTTNATRTTSYVILQPSGGNVGIGTSTPVSLLQGIGVNTDYRLVDQGTNGPAIVGINTNGGKAVGLVAGTNGAVFAYDKDNSGFFAIQAETHAAFTGNTLGNGPLYLTVDSTGRVGIGAGTSYSNLLSVSGAVSVGVGYIGTSAPTNGMAIQGALLVGSTTNIGGDPFKVRTSTTDNNIGIRTSSSKVQVYTYNDAGNAYNNLLIDAIDLVLNSASGGNVKIGASTARGTTEGTKHLDIFNGTSPAGTLTNGISLYSSSGQIKGMDAVGTAMSIGGAIFTQTADATVTNSVAETSIIGTGVGTTTLPANFFVAGKTIRLRIGGIYSTPALATPSIVIKVKYGATVLATVTTSSLLSGATNLEFDGEISITCRSTGATGTVMAHGDIEYSTGLAGTISVDPLNNAGATTTINTTTSNALDCTVAWDTATATRIVKSTVTTIEVLN